MVMGGGGEGGGFRFPQIYISSRWVRIRLHTKIQLPRLPASTIFWWGCDCDRHRDGARTKATPSLLTKDFGWSLTKFATVLSQS